ncbi:MAG: hypothetical protein ABIK92_21655 [Pseudomonadota bacterium]
MKKSILGFVLGLLLIGSNGFAADGDLIVNGNVGVGTTTPTEKLDVNGTVKATGFVGPGIIRQILSVSPTSDISTSSTTFVDMPEMSITLTTGNSILLIFWNATLYSNLDSVWVTVETQLDGIAIGSHFGGSNTSRDGVFYNTVDSSGGHAVATVQSGTHTVKLLWKVNSGIGYNKAAYKPDYYGRTITVIEVGQ